MEEFSDGIEDVSAPEDGFGDGGEIVVHEDDFRGFFGDFGAGNAHAKANMRELKGKWGGRGKKGEEKEEK